MLVIGRTMMCLVLVLWMNGNYILEQPASSVMSSHPRFVEMARLKGQHSINTFLGAWKHWTAKLTSFYSNQPLDYFIFTKQRPAVLPAISTLGSLTIFQDLRGASGSGFVRTKSFRVLGSLKF